MRRAPIALVLALISLLAIPAAAASKQAADDHVRPATYGVATTRDIPVKMSDGVTLYVNVYRPADSSGAPAKGRFPVILTQTPYNKNAALNFENDFLVQRGYVQVISDVRGTGSSEGDWDSFGMREQKDGAELVRWTTKQPWSDGDVGLYGVSYGAINQLFTAEQPGMDAIKAIFPIVPMSDAYRDITASGGQLNTSFIPSWLGLVTGTSLVPPFYSPTNPAEAAQVLAQHGVNVTKFQAATLMSSTTGGSTAYDGAFYKTRSPIERISNVHTPTFIVGGWYDLFQRGEPLLFQSLQSQGVPTKLLMGPWYHTDPSLNGDSLLTAHHLPTLEQLELQWFDHYMLGKPMPVVDSLANVTYFRPGAGRFDSSPSWPPPDSRPAQVYLSGPAAMGSPGSLTHRGAPKTQTPDQLPWNPASGTCTRTIVQWTAGDGKGTPCETNDVANDQTGLSYDMPLSQSLDIAGPIAARLFVSTTAKDAFLAVRVEDLSADGSNSTQLSAGWQTLSLRALDPKETVRQDGLIVRPYHPFTKASVLPVKPGTIYEVWVEIFPTAAQLAKGDTLRISIAPSDWPHLSAPLPALQNEAGGVLSVYHDAKHPSAIILPVQG